MAQAYERRDRTVIYVIGDDRNRIIRRAPNKLELKDGGNEIREYEPEYVLNDPENNNKATKVSWILVLTTISTSLGCTIPTGFNTGVVNAPAQVLKQWCNETILERYDVQLTPAQIDGLWSILLSIFLLGGIVGGISGGKLADLFGRKGTLKLIYLMYVVSGVIFLCSKSLAMVELFFVARLVSGLSAGLTMAMVPMFLLELSPPNKKGVFGVLFVVGLNFGVMSSQFLGLRDMLGTETMWPYLFSFYAGLVILVLPTLPFIPESPKYLYVVRNEQTKALSELSRLRGKPMSDVSWELDDLLVSTEVWTLKRVLCDPASRKALIITCVLMLGQQLSGINAIFYYSTAILQKTGISLYWAQYANLGAGLIDFSMAILSTLFIEKFGRKTLLLVSSIICTCMQTSIMISMVVMQEYSVQWVSFFLVSFVFGYVFFYEVGLGPIPFFIGTELTDVGPRLIMMSAMTVSNLSGNFLVGLLFPFVHRFLNEFCFLPFILCTLFTSIFTWKVAPETKRTAVEPTNSIKTKG